MTGDVTAQFIGELGGAPWAARHRAEAGMIAHMCKRCAAQLSPPPGRAGGRRAMDVAMSHYECARPAQGDQRHKAQATRQSLAINPRNQIATTAAGVAHPLQMGETQPRNRLRLQQQHRETNL